MIRINKTYTNLNVLLSFHKKNSIEYKFINHK